MYLKNVVSIGVLLYFATICGLVRGQTYENAKTLKSTLLASYDKDVIPVEDQSKPLNINMTLYLYGLPSVDPVNGALTMAVMMISEWNDAKMTWTPAAHGGIEEVFIPSSDVWTPYLTTGNPIQMATLDQGWMPVRYSNTGQAFFTPGNVVECSCKFYMKFWPFDKQVCTLDIFPYGYMVDRVTLSVPGTVANTAYYKKNPEWNLADDAITYTIDNSLGNSQVKFHIRIMRQPDFYMLTVIMPIVGIGMLTCLIFFIPTASGDRLGYAITVFLTLAVFLTVTAEDLPKTSDPATPILCMLILYSTIVCMAGNVTVILNLAIYYRGETEPVPPVSAWYRTLVQIAFCRRCRRRKVNDVSVPLSPMPQDGVKGPKRIQVQEAADDQTDESKEDDVTWKDVSYAIDRICIIALFFIVVIPSISLVIYMAAASDYIY